ncbi:hypothetical protein VAPA_1c25310 [Variovorax paradoxus B4]|uniref:Uncharacterized protein n=2 Tax=Variovorax paradoxus TaxID=34073 RepID=A0A0H2M7B9_VARPD|nr:hypothetical protein [Variovorax paradoxus]AGU49631.1 hypothetical protein VAPA_1c25310 [Variovorax paradoxus B4]KLN57956.1 hypothetical protein VPARA_09680 [Variovorax paradoxus]
MENMPATLWIAACAHRLQQQWHTVDPLELEDVARDLWRDERLRSMPPEAAAVEWLKPITERLGSVGRVAAGLEVGHT